MLPASRRGVEVLVLVTLMIIGVPVTRSVAQGAAQSPGGGGGADVALDRAAIEREVVAVLDAYMAAFNRVDVAAWERTFHFPHYRLAGGQMTVLERPGQQDQERLRARLEAIGWHHSGWDRRQIVHLSAEKVHVDTHFIRYRADGTVLASFDSLYVLTREDGVWGVKLRSSFAP